MTVIQLQTCHDWNKCIDRKTNLNFAWWSINTACNYFSTVSFLLILCDKRKRKILFYIAHTNQMKYSFTAHEIYICFILFSFFFWLISGIINLFKLEGRNKMRERDFLVIILRFFASSSFRNNKHVISFFLMKRKQTSRWDFISYFH